MTRIRFAAALLILPVVAARAADEKPAKTEPKPAEKLLLPEAFRGLWELDAGRLIEMPFMQKVPAEKREAAAGQLKKTLDGVTWDFGADKVTMRKGETAIPDLPVEIAEIVGKEARGRIKRADGRWDEVRFVPDPKGFILHVGQIQAPVKRAGK